MNVPALSGARVTLRRPVDEDADAWLNLPRDPEIVRMFGGDPALIRPKTRAQAEHWLRGLRERAAGWAITVEERFIGEIFLHSLADHDRRARLAVGIFAPDLLGRGLGREAIGLVLDHAFADVGKGGLGLNRVDLRVIGFNTRAIRCYRACGFVEEGREREAACVAGEFHDDVIMGLLAREHRR